MTKNNILNKIIASFILLFLGVGGYYSWNYFAEKRYLEWKVKEYLKDLRVGDVLVIKSNDKVAPYTLLKVTNIADHHITYRRSQFRFSNKSGVIDQMLNPQPDNGIETVTIPESKLQNFNIIDIYGEMRPLKILRNVPQGRPSK